MSINRILLILTGICSSQLAIGQTDSVMVRIAADTLSSDQQEGGISVKALEYYNTGLAKFSEGETQAAVEQFSEAIREVPNFAKALYNRAGAYMKLEDYPAAIADIDAFVGLTDTATYPYFLRARAYHLMGNEDMAISSYGEAIERNVETETASIFRAELYFRKGMVAESEADYTAAILVNPKNAQAYHDRGSMRKVQEKWQAAADDYNSAIRLDPRMAIAYNNLGAVYRKMDRNADALGEYNQALRLEPENVQALNNRGYTYFLLEEYEKAEADFRKAVEIDPDYAYALNNLASALIKQERFQEAIDSATEALNLDANYGYAYLNRGIAREMVRDIPGACADWEKAASMNIQNADAYRSVPCKY
jgi:tetratricopeptide (TPR) repeat protein